MQVSPSQVHHRRCMCQMLHAPGVGQEKVALLVNNTPASHATAAPDEAVRQSRDVKMFRTATAQEHSSFMSASLMNERSPLSLTPGKMVHSTGCFIDIPNSSQRREKKKKLAVAAAAALRKRREHTCVRSASEPGPNRCGHL